MKMPDTGKKVEKSNIFEMFQYLTENLDEKERKSWKVLAVLNLISPVVDIFSFSVIIYIINRAIYENQASEKLVALTLGMIGISALKCVFELYKSKISNRFIFGGAQKLSIKIYEMLIKEDLIAHYQKSAMQALAMVRQDTTNCVQIIVSCIGICVNGITMVGYAIVLIYVSKWFGVVSSAALAVLMAIVYTRTRKRMRIFGEKSRSYAIRANAQITIAHGSFKEMKIDDRSAFVLRKYQDASAGYAQVQGEYQYKLTSIGVILQNSVMGLMFAVLAVILLAGSNFEVILAPMVVYITALVRMLPMAYNILNGMNSVEFARKPYVTLREAIAKYADIKAEEEKMMSIRQKKLTFRQGISIRGLTFGYHESRNIFEDASIDIPVGCSIAIIGASGSGKTTFLDLILGLLKPQGGHVYYDDYDIVEHADREGRCRAGIGQLASYIPQTVYLNGETIRHNVAFFEEDENIDDKKVEECLRCAQIWDDVQKMPDGVDTLIGENGTAISGGQRQRIALARALYKDFAILVMDEATAALDMETEQAVIESIRHVKGDKTLLMVTHHMSLANECDVIYKIENKKIVQVKGRA